MKILTSEKLVLFAGADIKKGIFDEPFEKWAIYNENGSLQMYALDNGFILHEVDSIPEDFSQCKYTYTESDGFSLNTDWVEPPKTAEERIEDLEGELADNECLMADMLADICELQLGI